MENGSSYRHGSGKPCQLGPPFCGIMCPEDWCLCHSLVCWYCSPGRLWAPRRPLIHGWILQNLSFFSRTLFCQWVFTTSSLLFAIVCGSVFTVHRMIRVLYLTNNDSQHLRGNRRESLWVSGQPLNETLSKQRAKTIMLSLTFESAVSSSWIVPPCPIT